MAKNIQQQGNSELKLNYHITPDQVFITRDKDYPNMVTITIAIIIGKYLNSRQLEE